jgi:hypothetical protein
VFWSLFDLPTLLSHRRPVPLRQYAQLFAGTLRLLNVDTRVVMMFQPMPVRPKVGVLEPF